MLIIAPASELSRVYNRTTLKSYQDGLFGPVAPLKCYQADLSLSLQSNPGRV